MVDGMHPRLLERWVENYTKWCADTTIGVDEARNRIKRLSLPQLVRFREILSEQYVTPED